MRGHDTRTGLRREPEAAVLDEVTEAHVARVRAGLREQILAAGGFLGFERYMEYALYEPGLGYYSSGARKLGRDGDFVTAPEISPLFGACVALQCADVLARVGQPVILELGAGTGRLAVDVLTRLESLGYLPHRYWILEISADLRERQQRTLALAVPHLLERVEWLSVPPAGAFDGVILANEVLDALPVARFRWGESGVEELGVVMSGDHFSWRARAAGSRMTQAVEELHAVAAGWTAGYVSEYCPRMLAWTRAVTAQLRHGAVLWFDYGLPRAQYYFAQRRAGTLMCHFRHRAHDDPFSHPGAQDITAWVDFTRLAEASRACGFELAGFTTQAHFLLASGIDREMQRLADNVGTNTDAGAALRLANQARRLMLPGEMGERFKVMGWLRGLEMELSGFSFVDLRHSL